VRRLPLVWSVRAVPAICESFTTTIDCLTEYSFDTGVAHWCHQVQGLCRDHADLILKHDSKRAGRRAITSPLVIRNGFFPLTTNSRQQPELLARDSQVLVHGQRCKANVDAIYDGNYEQNKDERDDSSLDLAGGASLLSCLYRSFSPT